MAEMGVSAEEIQAMMKKMTDGGDKQVVKNWGHTVLSRYDGWNGLLFIRFHGWLLFALDASVESSRYA
jgi:hypothetical protein